MMVFIAMASLIAIIGMCTAGIFYNGYRDNWLQHVGLILTALSSSVMVLKFQHAEYVPETMAFFSLGVAVFMAGTAHKVWVHSQPKRDDPPDYHPV
jgi:hypothetical protein